MKKLSLALTAFLALTMCFTSCRKSDEVQKNGMVEVFFDASFPSSDKKDGHIVNEPIPTNCEEALASVYMAYIEIRPEGAASDGSEDLDFTSEVFVFQDGDVDMIRTKEGLLLPPGNHQVVSFYVSDESGDPLLAVPTQNSEYSTFVDTPLPQPCVVRDGDRKSYKNLEILCIDLENEPNFGFKYFDLAVVRTMPFCVLGNICDEYGMHHEARFALKVWRYTGDCARPKGKKILMETNFEGDAGGFDDNGSLEEQARDALLCTYLPDRTDEEDCFWMEIWAYDPESPWANEEGYYLVECGSICETEIKDKWDDKTEYGVDNNFFHWQVSHSMDCTPAMRFLNNDCCEQSFYYSNIEKTDEDGSQFGIFKYVLSANAGMFVQSWYTPTPDNTHIAYNADNKVLYAVDDETLYLFQNDMFVETKDYVDASAVSNTMPQAVYAYGKLYVGDQGKNLIHVVELDGYGYPVGVIQSIEASVAGGDLVVQKDGEDMILWQFNNNAAGQKWMLNMDGTIDEGSATSVPNFGQVTGAAVVNGILWFSETGVGIRSADGTLNLFDAGLLKVDPSNFEWGDMASCGTVIESLGTPDPS